MKQGTNGVGIRYGDLVTGTAKSRAGQMNNNAAVGLKNGGTTTEARNGSDGRNAGGGTTTISESCQ